jgi:hypothetical protein
MAPPSPVALFKCPAFAAQSRSVLDGLLSPIRKCRAALSESPCLIRPPLVLTQSRSLSKKRPGGPSPVLQYATTTFFPMRKPCRSRSQVRSLRAYRQTNGPCDQVIPGSKTFSVEQHPSADETVKICACPSDQERGAGAFHRSGRRKAQGRRTARTYIQRHRKG